MRMMKITAMALLAAAPLYAAHAQKMGAEATVMVGGEAMCPMKDIVTNAMNSKDHTTLVSAVKAADLVATLQGPGPFTVLAPTNAAFNMLPAGTVDGLLKPESRKQLTGVLTYHVLPGKLDMAAIAAAIKKGGGKAMLKTVQGQELTFAMNGPKNISVWDATGAYANISVYDVLQSNGVIHVIDRVLMPKM